MRVAATILFFQSAELFGNKEVVSLEIQVVLFLRIMNKFIQSVITSSSLATLDDKSNFLEKAHIHGILFIRVLTSVFLQVISIWCFIFQCSRLSISLIIESTYRI